MKNAKQLVEKYLNEEPRFRERKNKDRGIVNILQRVHPVLLEPVSLKKDLLVTIVQQYATLDRAWRQALERNPELRGSDYDDKTRLEQEKQIELGYEVGYHADVKKEIA